MFDQKSTLFCIPWEGIFSKFSKMQKMTATGEQMSSVAAYLQEIADKGEDHCGKDTGNHQG